MKKLILFVAIVIVATFSFAISAVCAEDAPDIVKLFDTYLIESNDLNYSCDSNQKMTDCIKSFLGEDVADQLVYSNKNIFIHGYDKSVLEDEQHSLITVEMNDSSTHLTSIILAEDVTKQIYRGQIGKEHFEYLPDDFKAYIKNVRLMGDVWEQNCEISGATITEEAFNTDGYIDLPIRDLSDEDRCDGPIYSDARESYEGRRNLDSDYSGDVFMTAPNRIVVCYEQGYRTWYSNMPDYQAEYYDFYIMLNYGAPEGVEEGDYMSYELESISFELVYDPHTAISAPQTGFATIAYATVAVVSAAAAVAVAKKRRGM